MSKRATLSNSNWGSNSKQLMSKMSNSWANEQPMSNSEQSWVTQFEGVTPSNSFSDTSNRWGGRWYSSDRVKSHDKTECKVKGHSLNVEGKTQLNYQVLRRNKLDKLCRPLDTPQKTVIHQASTQPAKNNYQLVYKCVLRPPAIMYPYGYRLTEEDSFTDNLRTGSTFTGSWWGGGGLRLCLHPEDEVRGANFCVWTE